MVDEEVGAAEEMAQAMVKAATGVARAEGAKVGRVAGAVRVVWREAAAMAVAVMEKVGLAAEAMALAARVAAGTVVQTVSSEAAVRAAR